MSTEMTIPEGGPAALFKDQNIPQEQLGEGVDSGGFNMVGIQGKSFYVKYKGKRQILVNPPANPPTEYDGHPAQYFDFVVLRQAKLASHTWYERGYQQGNEDRPDCVSTDGIAPDDNSKKPQSELCQLCPQHEWKMQPNGRDGRACTDSLRLAVLPMPKLMVAVLGEPITEPILFRVPAASMKNLKEFGDQMTKRFGGNAPIFSYVLRVTFDSGTQYPKFEYRVARWLSEGEAAQILELREDPLAYRILGQTPDGNSIVRRGPVKLVAQDRQVSADNSAMAIKLADERMARIAAVRQAEKPLADNQYMDAQGNVQQKPAHTPGAPPKQIEHEAEEIVLAPKPKLVEATSKEVFDKSPIQLDSLPDETPPMGITPVDDATDDIDALIASMRPKPPVA